MTQKQIQDAYIVAATRTPVARRNGAFRHVRPDDLLAHVLEERYRRIGVNYAHGLLFLNFLPVQ